jgi:hypothetical protein
VSNSGERRAEVLFALGNLVPAIVLGVGLYALPVRWWPADFVIGAAVVALPVTSGIVFGRPPLSRRALRVGASVLLAIGLVLITAAVLSLAFLAGIHGDFGQGGVTLMALVTFLVLPYVIVYPVLELLWVGPRGKKDAVSTRAAADRASAEHGTAAGKNGLRSAGGAAAEEQTSSGDGATPPAESGSSGDGGAPA